MPDEIQSIATGAFHDLNGMLGAYASGLPDGFLADLFRIALGTFIGIAVALFLAMARQNRLRRLERKAAGNLAVSTLGRLASDFIQARAVLLNYRDFVLRDHPRLPIWLHLKPARFSYPETLRFDFPSLAFLYDMRGGPEAIEMLMLAESLYHDFFGLLRAYLEVSDTIQERCAQARIDPLDPRRVQDLAGAAGPAAVSKAQALTHAIMAHVERSENTFRKIAEALPAVLRDAFGRKGVRGIDLPSYTELRKALELSEDGLRTPPIRA